MIAARIIFPLATASVTWHPAGTPRQDMYTWLASSPLGLSGGINATSHPTKAFAAHTPFCTVARGVRAMPNTRSAITGCGVRCPKSAGDFRTAKQPRRRCAPIAAFMPIGQTNRPQSMRADHRVVAASAPRRTRAKAAQVRLATAAISPFAAWPCPRSALQAQPMHNQPHPISLARPSMAAARMAAAAQTVRSRRAMADAADAADAIAVHPADSRSVSCADSGSASRAGQRAGHRSHCIVTDTPVAPTQLGFPYSYNTQPASRRQSFGETP